MNWKKHLFYGLLLQLLFIGIVKYFYEWYVLTPILITQIIIILIISPLVPDLDCKIGKLHTWIMTIGFLIAGIGTLYWALETQIGLLLGNGWLRMIFLGLIITGATFFNTQISKHRGFWHSIPMGIIYATFIALITGLNIQLGVLSFFGFWTHLLLDGTPFKIK